MYNSFWLSLSPNGNAGKLNLLALPRWAELSLKSAGQTPEGVANTPFSFDESRGFEDYRVRAETIMSSRELGFHDNVTNLLDAYLFPDMNERRNWYGKPEELYAELTRAWYGVPLSSSMELCIHPVILGPDTIALMHSEPIPGVTDVNLYERLLRCVYTLSANKVGMHAFDSDLFKAVLTQFMKLETAVKAA